MTASFAPVALFVYNRPDHLSLVSGALARNPESARTPLFVFVDAPRSDAVAAKVAEVRTLARGVRGFAAVEVIEQSTNLGIAGSIIQGVTHLAGEFGKVIVLEDDLLPSTHFLGYINRALDVYADDERVISVHAYTYPVATSLPESFFLRGADCWGWGTWKRGWDLFEPDGGKLLAELDRRQATREFDFDGAYPYTQMLRDCIAGRNDSWAIRWYASAFLKGRLTLYPGSSQVQNIGADGSGVHVGDTKRFEHSSWGRRVVVGTAPVEESKEARRAFIDYLAGLRPSAAVRLLRRFRGLVSTPAD